MFIRDVIDAQTTLNEWKTKREGICRKIQATLGEKPEFVFEGAYRTAESYARHELRHEEISFEALPGFVAQATIVYPGTTPSSSRAPACVCIHGTDTELARKGVLDPSRRPDRAYGIELAKRGYLVIAVDLYGFGDWIGSGDEAECYERFHRAYPRWCLDGMWLHLQSCAVTILQRHPLVDSSKIATIGNSLGGRCALFLSAFDERVGAAAVSTGVSPNTTNVFRLCRADPVRRGPCAALSAELQERGKPPYEYNELIALVAPRGLLLMEPFNDPYNPYVEPALECFLRARHVWELEGKPENLAFLCHGRGHTTPKEMREYAYRIIDFSLGLA